jgi:signal transduction histidine kinase
MFILGAFTLTASEVSKRKEYLEITSEDERRLKEAHVHLESHVTTIIERFYEYLLSHDHTRQMFSAPGLVERLKGLQTKYFRELTSGEYGLKYFENRLRVGQVHHRIGLAPEWYLGAYDKYLQLASDVLSTAFGRDYERFFQTIISLNKIISLDKGLALDAYHYSAKEALERQANELKKANEGLQRLQDTKQQLSDMIVHDLQNPLAGVISVLQTFDSKPTGLRPDEREILKEGLRRCDDLSQMILNVLQISRADSGHLETHFEGIDLASLASDVTESFRIVADVEGRTLVFESPPSVPIRSDRSLIQRVLQNLIRNALRHTPKDTQIVVRVDVLPAGRARVRVIDDGPGISTEVQSHLFDPFGATRLRNAGMRVDVGLGLASCKVAAQALEAEISVESDGIHGTSFALLFAASY